MIEGTKKELGSSARARLPLADVVLGVGVLALFALALLQTFDWSFRTALFPRMVTIAGCVLTAAFLISCAVSRRRRIAPGPATPATSSEQEADGQELVDEDDEHDHEIEYVYATAGRAAWATALAWIALFVLLVWVAGLFVASAVFAFSYIRWGASRSWRFAAVYALVMSGVLYLFLGILLTVPVPEGLLG
jgi:hypothetical protein